MSCMDKPVRLTRNMGKTRYGRVGTGPIENRQRAQQSGTLLGRDKVWAVGRLSSQMLRMSRLQGKAVLELVQEARDELRFAE